MKYYLSSIFIFSTAALFSLDYSKIEQGKPWIVEGLFRQTGKASFDTEEVKNTHLKYTEGRASLSYSIFANRENAITAELGYLYHFLDWKDNPVFTEGTYQNALASLSWLSYSLERWRWIVNLGAMADAQDLDFGHTGVLYGLIWGTFAYTENLKLHFGMISNKGIENSYTMPVIGFDYSFAESWKITLLYPAEFSLRYTFSPHFSTALTYQPFGVLYRLSRRIRGGIGIYQDGIWQSQINGVEWDLDFKQNSFSIGLAAGVTTGGWLLARDSENHHTTYYKLDSAPYASAKMAWAF